MADLFNKNKIDSTDSSVSASSDQNLPGDSNMDTNSKKINKKKNKQLFLEHNSMNFLDRYQTVVEGKAADKGLDAYKKPILALLIVLVLLALIAQALNIFSSLRLKSINDYINDPDNISSYNLSILTKDNVSQATIQKNNLLANLDAMASYPDLDKSLFDAIANAANTNGVVLGTYGYSGSTGYLAISGCTAQTPDAITNFIRAAEATGLFTDFDYQGFSGGGEAGGYTYNISFYLASPTAE